MGEDREEGSMIYKFTLFFFIYKFTLLQIFKGYSHISTEAPVSPNLRPEVIKGLL